MIENELVTGIRSGDPDNIPSIDMWLTSYKRAFAKLPRHEEREEGLLINNLIDFLEEKLSESYL